MDTPENPNRPPERVIELSPRKWLILRLIIACIFGAVIVFFSLRAGYDAAKYESPSPWLSQGQTEMELKILMAEIAEYQQNHGALPRTLVQLQHDPALGGLSVEDAWGRPFVYTIHGEDFSVTSYGQDGQLGGTGWDKDLIWSSRTEGFHFVYSLPSFRQYLTASVTREANETAMISGILAAVLCFISLKPRPLTRWSIVGLVAKIGVVLFAAVVVGAFITELHIPTGH